LGWGLKANEATEDSAQAQLCASFSAAIPRLVSRLGHTVPLPESKKSLNNFQQTGEQYCQLRAQNSVGIGLALMETFCM
jgi:hypothetical protein